jgi:DNA-binding protein HU-beta
MNRRELITAIAAQSDAEPKTVEAVLRGFTDVVCATVAKGDPVVLTGFAKFAKIQTKARMGRNPATGEAIKIKASKKARITALKGFKDIVLGAAPAPKLTKPAPTKAAPAKATAKTTARTTAPRTTAARTTATKAPSTRTRTTKATTRRSPARSATKR